MSIAYLPSEGGINKVGLTEDNLWYGDSIGGAILDKIKVKRFSDSGSYFNYQYSNLNSTSRWFFKDVTEYNFVKGITIYRCMYIGADERFKESEFLNDIQCSITHNGPVEVNSSVAIDIATDGKFTVFTSRNTSNLETEQDTSSVLSNRNDWVNTLNIGEVLKPGEYIKVWVRLKFSANPLVANFTNYDYFVTINDLTIPMRRVNGRLPMSKVFGASLSGDRIVLKESLPSDFQVNDIYKVIDNGKYLNIFYIEDKRIKLLIIKTAETPSKSKYIQMDINNIVPGIVVDNQFASNFSQCFTTAITGTDGSITGSPSTTGTSGTSGTSGSPETSGYPVDTPDIDFDYNTVVGKQFLVDIVGTEKQDRNDFYLFFNTFLLETDDEYLERYGHKNYYWNCGVVHINLIHINDVFFENVESGYDNIQNISLTNQYTDIIHTRFFINSITAKDELITGVGYIPEDCRIVNNKSKMFYIWEGDIVNRKPLMQMFDIPSTKTVEINTIKN